MFPRQLPSEKASLSYCLACTLIRSCAPTAPPGPRLVSLSPASTSVLREMSGDRTIRGVLEAEEEAGLKQTRSGRMQEEVANARHVVCRSICLVGWFAVPCIVLLVRTAPSEVFNCAACESMGIEKAGLPSVPGMYSTVRISY